MIQPTALLNLTTSPLALAPVGTGGTPGFDLSLAMPQFAALPVQPLAVGGKALPMLAVAVAFKASVTATAGEPATVLTHAAPLAIGGDQPDDAVLDQPMAASPSQSDPASLPTAFAPTTIRGTGAPSATLPSGLAAAATRARSAGSATSQPIILLADALAGAADPIPTARPTEPTPENARPVPTAISPAASILPPLDTASSDDIAAAAPSAVPTGTSHEAALDTTGQTSNARPSTQTPPSLPVMADGSKADRSSPVAVETDRSAPERKPETARPTTLGMMPIAVPVVVTPTTPMLHTGLALAEPVATSASNLPYEPVTASPTPLPLAVQATPTDQPTRAISPALQPDPPLSARACVPLSMIDQASERSLQDGEPASESPADGDDRAVQQPGSQTDVAVCASIDKMVPPLAAPVPPVAVADAPVETASVATASAALRVAVALRSAPIERRVEASPVPSAQPVTAARQPVGPERQPGVTAIPIPGSAAAAGLASTPPVSSSASQMTRAAAPEPLAVDQAATSPVNRGPFGEPATPVVATSVPTPTITLAQRSDQPTAPASPAATAVLSFPPMTDTVTRPTETIADAPVQIRSATAQIGVAPSAPGTPQLVAGATAPAFRLFAAAIHAARADENERATAAAPTPLAPVEQPRAALPVASAQEQSLDMADHRWPHAMVEHIERLQEQASATRDAASTTIRLVPDALGTIDVAVRRDGDTVHVHMAAEQAATRTLIADAQPRLHELAEAKGIRLAQAGVGAGTDGQAQRQPTPQPARAAAAPRSAVRDDEPELATTTRIG